MTEWLHPGILLIVGALIVPLLRGSLKKAWLVVLPAAAFVSCVMMKPGTYGVFQFLGYTLTFGRVDSLSLLFAYVFTLMATIGFIYALHVREDGQHVAAMLYVGSALGATFAGDLLVLFIFWEIMAFASVCLVWYQRSVASIRAGFRYLLFHVFGGLCLLAGIIVHVSQTGSIAFDSMMVYEGGLAFYLILLGFVVNAAVPPLGAWLPDAYPEATVTGAVFMSAYTTKTAVYVLLRGFAGTEVLMWAGAIMAVYGVIYATMENNSRRLLAYHIISQVGFMVCGVGIGTEMAVNGASAHAFAHIIYKGLLFMSAGAVLYMAGTAKLTELGGLHKTMPLTMLFFFIGGLSIAGAPLMSGFISKSMTISAAGAEHEVYPFLLMNIASSGTFLSIVLKLGYHMFFGRDSGIRAGEPPLNMRVAMAIASALCIFIGCVPGSLYAVLPYAVEYEPYTAQHVVSALGLFGFTTVGFMLFMKKLEPKPLVNLDTDWFYRKGAKAFMWIVNKPVARFEYNVVGEAYEYVMRRPVLGLSRWIRSFDGWVMDNLVRGIGGAAFAFSELFRSMQSGKVHDYAFGMSIGVLIIFVITLFW